MSYKINTDRLRAYIDENYGSMSEFARVAGLSKSYVALVLSGDRTGGGKFIASLMSLGWDKEDIFLPEVPTKVDKRR